MQGCVYDKRRQHREMLEKMSKLPILVCVCETHFRSGDPLPERQLQDVQHLGIVVRVPKMLKSFSTAMTRTV